jgi:hypothetical protein
MAKLAVPVAVGVPDIANTKFPFPDVKVPGCMDAVNPSMLLKRFDPYDTKNA